MQNFSKEISLKTITLNSELMGLLDRGEGGSAFESR
jgi:hypothetical protein